MTFVDFLIDVIPVIFIPIAVVLLAKAFNLEISDFLKFISWLLSGFKNIVDKIVGNIFEKNNSELQRMAFAKRSKKFFYRYQNFVNDILLDLKWKEKGLTVQTATVANVIESFAVGLICAFVFRSVFTIVMFMPLSFILNICLLFMISRNAHSYRVSLIRTAENTLCINMNLGIREAVKVSLNSLPVDIRYVFEEFLYNANNTGMGVIAAIDKLNDSLGSDFDSFCKKAKTITLNSSMSADIFLDNIKHNRARSEEEADVKKTYKELNTIFFLGVGAMFVFMGLVFTMVPSITEFLTSALGELWVFAIAFPIVIMFMNIQLQFSKKL